MNYPTLKSVESADEEQIQLWYYSLPAPGENHTHLPDKEFQKILKEEFRVLILVNERYAKFSKAKRPSLYRKAKEIRDKFDRRGYGDKGR